MILSKYDSFQYFIVVSLNPEFVVKFNKTSMSIMTSAKTTEYMCSDLSFSC